MRTRQGHESPVNDGTPYTAGPDTIAIATVEGELRERLPPAEDRLRGLLDAAHDYAIGMLGPDGEIVSRNAGAERTSAFRADEIVGRDYACYFPAAERENGVAAHAAPHRHPETDLPLTSLVDDEAGAREALSTVAGTRETETS